MEDVKPNTQIGEDEPPVENDDDEEEEEEEENGSGIEVDEGRRVLQGRIHLVRGPLIDTDCVLVVNIGTSTNPLSLS